MFHRDFFLLRLKLLKPNRLMLRILVQKGNYSECCCFGAAWSLTFQCFILPSVCHMCAARCQGGPQQQGVPWV